MNKGDIMTIHDATHKGIYWLASYPKSGNTWFRIVLASLLSETQIDINQLSTGKIASNRAWVEEALGFNSTYLSHEELDAIRPEAYAYLGKTLEVPSYHKIHDAYTQTEQGPLLPKEGCLGALYFIRNPLDVAISYAHHSANSIDDIIIEMSKEQAAFCQNKFRFNLQIRQHLLSWSMHVKTWTEQTEIPVLTLRYEDMKYNALDTFMQAFQFLKLNPTHEKLAHALEQSRIEKLQAQETEHGFREKPSKMPNFFRKGIVGDWQNILTEAQISRIIEDHREVMERFHYIDANGIPVL